MKRITAPLLVLLSSSMLVLVSTVAGPTAARAAAPSCASMSAPLRQLVNPASRASFVTTSSSEAAAVKGKGFTEDRGVLGGVSTRADGGLSPVHRLYRQKTGDYLWTLQVGEVRSAVVRHGYVDQGTTFFASGVGGDCLVPVYRFSRKGQHRLASSSAERERLTAEGWRSEGITMYVASNDPAPPSTDSTFSIAVIPDTQQEVGTDSRFKNRSQWLVSNRTALDLRYVAHSGDVVNWDTPDHRQYEVASAAMKPIENAGIPYSLAIGNHDTAAVCTGGSACDPKKTRTLVRNTQTFNRYFTAARFGAVGGAFEAGKVDNIYSTFSAGGEKWLVLDLELWPRRAAVAWARKVVADHPSHNVMVVTHDYLNSGGKIGGNSASYGETSPQYLWDNLIKVYPNIKMTFSGHVGRDAAAVYTGAKGNKIYSFLQAFHSNSTNPVRLVTIDTKAGTLKTWVYGPYTKETFAGTTRSYSGIAW